MMRMAGVQQDKIVSSEWSANISDRLGGKQDSRENSPFKLQDGYLLSAQYIA